jgi:hypothetical protein
MICVAVIIDDCWALVRVTIKSPILVLLILQPKLTLVNIPSRASALEKRKKIFWYNHEKS